MSDEVRTSTESVIRKTIRCHCDEAWVGRGRHSPYCEQEIVVDWFDQIMEIVAAEPVPQFSDPTWGPEPYGDCRCGRHLVCGLCYRPPGDCDCSDAWDDLEEECAQQAGEDVADLDPLTRTLLGLPSGIDCRTLGYSPTE